MKNECILKWDDLVYLGVSPNENEGCVNDYDLYQISMRVKTEPELLSKLWKLIFICAVAQVVYYSWNTKLNL